MQWVVLSASVLFVACLGANCATAQTAQWGQAQDQIPPYGTHIDRRHAHDHEYPDRGAVVRDLPHGAAAVHYAGLSYRFAGGVWYERVGPAYIVVAPPIGVVVPQLPAFATSFDSAGKTYLYANDAFYRARPDLGGYEVVNDPQDDVVSRRSQAPPDVSSPRPAVAVPKATQAPPQSTVQPENQAVPLVAPTSSPSSDVPAPANPTGVAIQPRRGQSADQQALDRYECYRRAVTQTGFDPLASNSGTPPGDMARHNFEYLRVQAACLEGRGYTVP